MIYEFSNDYLDVVLGNGCYFFELWGASGFSDDFCSGGYGSYVNATINLYVPTEIKLYIGGTGNFCIGGFNGGGYGIKGTETEYCSGGGGSTDIRYNSSLNSRILVAAGGGGYGSYYSACKKGSNGDASGKTGDFGGYGGTQTSGGLGGIYSASIFNGKNGTFGFGGNATGRSYSGGGGGSGYYGGGGSYEMGGGGGSSYIHHYIIGNNIKGGREMPHPDGSIKVGYMGNGAIKIIKIPCNKYTSNCQIMNGKFYSLVMIILIVINIS